MLHFWHQKFVKNRNFSSLMDVQISDCPSASCERIFLTQPALRKMEMRCRSTGCLRDRSLGGLIIGCGSTFRKVVDVEGIRIGQLPIVVKDSAENMVWKSIEIALFENLSTNNFEPLRMDHSYHWLSSYMCEGDSGDIFKCDVAFIQLSMKTALLFELLATLSTRSALCTSLISYWTDLRVIVL